MGPVQTRAMNVLHVTPYYAPAWAYGSVPFDVAALARAQVALGHSATVLTTDAMAPHERLHSGVSFVDGVRVVRVRNLSGATRTWLRCSTPVGFRRTARRLLASDTFDVVHLHELVTVENLCVVPIVPRTTPIAASLHGTFTGRHAPPSWQSRAWKLLGGGRVRARIDRVVVTPDEAVAAGEPSPWLAEPLRPAEFQVVPNGVDLSAFASAPDRCRARADMGWGQGPVVLCVGPISDAEALGMLISAFALVHDALPTARLVIAGPDAGTLAALRGRADALGRTRAIVFPGYLAPARVRTALAAADLFVVPHAGNADPRLLLEALACGVPLLAARGSGAVDAVACGAALTVEHDATAWADAMRLVLSDGETHARMEEAARRIAAGSGWPAIAAQWLALYDDLANNSRR